MQSFHEGMINVEQECYDMDRFTIEHDVECDKNTAFACERADIMNTEEYSLFGAPLGWMPPQPPKDWMPIVKINKGGEPLFHTADKFQRLE